MELPMKLQSVVNDVKGRVELISDRGQKVVTVSRDSLKQAGGIVAEGLQTLVNTQTSAAKDLYSAARTGLEKAKTDGLRAVAADPIRYLPKVDKLVVPFNHSVTVVSKTGDELYQVAKTGFSRIQAQIAGKATPVASATKKAKTAVRKTKTTVKKVVAKAVEAE
jgi:hypothetical protein